MPILYHGNIFRPVKFDSKEAEIQWEKATATNALKFKTSVESGEFIPEEIAKKIAEKAQRTPKEEEILKKEKVLSVRKEKVRQAFFGSFYATVTNSSWRNLEFFKKKTRVFPKIP